MMYTTYMWHLSAFSPPAPKKKSGDEKMSEYERNRGNCAVMGPRNTPVLVFTLSECLTVCWWWRHMTHRPQRELQRRHHNESQHLPLVLMRARLRAERRAPVGLPVETQQIAGTAISSPSMCVCVCVEQRSTGCFPVIFRGPTSHSQQ